MARAMWIAEAEGRDEAIDYESAACALAVVQPVGLNTLKYYVYTTLRWLTKG